ncbi:hypothetical protein JCM10212_003779 [Sporobolomyces blumeae]
MRGPLPKKDNRVLISTLHNSIKLIDLSLAPEPSSTNPTSVPTLSALATFHAPARPLLWTSRFSKSRYDVGNGDRQVRLAGGSLLGEVLVWDFDASELATFADKSENVAGGAVVGTIRRLSGHRGAIFTVAFCPSNPSRLATGSDDRTIRVWDLSTFGPASETQSKDVEAECPVSVLWGHEGRVWRIDWVDDHRLASVAEDATCRLWHLRSTSPAAATGPLAVPSSARRTKAPTTESDHELLQTWRDGHDGRSIWSVCAVDDPLSRPRTAGTGTESVPPGRLVLTGGADGAVRMVALPSRQILVDPTSRSHKPSVNGKRKATAIKSFVVAVDPVSDRIYSLSLAVDGSFRLSDPSIPIDDVKPFYSSPTFANSPASLHVTLELSAATTSTTIEATVYAFSNKGSYLTSRLSFPTDPSNGAVFDPAEIVVDSYSVVDLGIKAVSSTLNAERTSVAIWERATWTVHVLDLPLSTSSSPPRTVSIEPSSDGTTAPTCFLFLDSENLVIGNARGRLSLHALSNTTDSDGFSGHVTETGSAAVHSNGVSSLACLGRESRAGGLGSVWTMESVGKDGMRKIVEIGFTEAGARRAEMNVVDERWIAKGPIDRIIAGENGERLYLGLVDIRAGIYDRLGQLLVSFVSPGKQIPSQFVQTRQYGIHYYRLMQGRLDDQSYPLNGTASFAPVRPTLLCQGLHGREIRATKMIHIRHEEKDVTIIATAAENGVLAVSSPDRASLPEVRVLPKGMVLAEAEGGEVRTMDIALVEADGRNLVLAGYSDGRAKVWHDQGCSFALLCGSTERDKCILSVAVEKMRVEGRERAIGILGRSDGRLNILDLTPFAQGSSEVSDLLAPLHTISAHQSGINGLSVISSHSTLTVATAGDDNAVSVHVLSLSGSDGLTIESRATALVADAHGSTIQGLNFLSPTLLASSSVEQRLNVYTLSRSSTPGQESSGIARDTLDVRIADSTCLDVADCSAMDVVATSGRRQDAPGGEADEGEGATSWKVAVVGIGVEVVKVESSQ